MTTSATFPKDFPAAGVYPPGERRTLEPVILDVVKRHACAARHPCSVQRKSTEEERQW